MGIEIGSYMSETANVWQGTLALMVLKTLETLGPRHSHWKRRTAT